MLRRTLVALAALMLASAVSASSPSSPPLPPPSPPTPQFFDRCYAVQLVSDLPYRKLGVVHPITQYPEDHPLFDEDMCRGNTPDKKRNASLGDFNIRAKEYWNRNAATDPSCPRQVLGGDAFYAYRYPVRSAMRSAGAAADGRKTARIGQLRSRAHSAVRLVLIRALPRPNARAPLRVPSPRRKSLRRTTGSTFLRRLSFSSSTTKTTTPTICSCSTTRTRRS